MRPIPEDRLEVLRQLWSAGLRQQEIAERMGVSPGVVAGWINRARARGEKGFNRRVNHAAAPKPKPKRLLSIEPSKRGGVPIWAIAPNGCRFPIGEHREHRGRHFFCNAPASGSYCPEHMGACLTTLAQRLAERRAARHA